MEQKDVRLIRMLNVALSVPAWECHLFNHLFTLLRGIIIKEVSFLQSARAPCVVIHECFNIGYRFGDVLSPQGSAVLTRRGTGSETDCPSAWCSPWWRQTSLIHTRLWISGPPRWQVSGLIAPGQTQHLIQLPFNSLGCPACFINISFCLVSTDGPLSSVSWS